MRRRISYAVVVLASTFLQAGSAFSCACCTNDGQRYVGSEKLAGYPMALLADIAFSPDAHLYTGEADVQDIDVVGAKAADFKLTVEKGETSWQFKFAQSGAEGTLELRLPGEVSRFEVDPRDTSKPSPGVGPALYKEWRLESIPRGTSMFADMAAAGGKAQLILHGSGNSCTDASQFHAWTLVLHGVKGTATFYGNLVTP
jgi:hypothetical protein